ncbi:double-strand break repair protein AddB [Maricaulis maris]|uniref:DNA helicase/exodeoxyribonuclease V subunit B n=1 Tax=Maricaulis maris TaxID=74318 RepID=A0A495D2L9_9PROT|nr:double-strand break repair protein AddB [Maricaulis maris]RKQ96018.1 DNA helicase/exodeoxyribonuclease V subunit B [Maricaulis maris]
MRLFDTSGPSLFTIPPQADFLRAIASTLREEFDVAANPDALTRLLILTPTRRAAKALGDVFADLAGNGVALLPLIRPIGDVDVDDPPFEPGELAGLAAPAISPERRRYELARLILAKEAALGRPIGVGGALSLADALAALLDDLATEDVSDLSALQEAVTSYLPADRREAVEFLDIVQRIWPARLDELGLTDAARRRSLVLHELVARWSRQAPDHPVLAVGSTGSIPAARDLMSVIASLPQGAVVLPGFDWDADETGWASIADDHPQWAMKTFLRDVGVERSAVRAWPGAAETAPAARRRRIIAEALRPADTTDEWLSRITTLEAQYGADFFTAGLDGLSLIETPDEISEARVCALLLREVLEHPDETAILVTPDRMLARRVSAEMVRFGVRLDDSGGAALAETPAGAFLTRLLDAATDCGSVIALTALWGSPLFRAGHRRGQAHTVLAKFEAEALRGARPGQDLAAIRARLDGKHVKLFDDDRAMINAILDRLDTAFAGLLGEERRPAAVWARAHAEAAEALAEDGTGRGADALWGGEGGEAAAGLVRSLLEESESLPEMRLVDYAAAFGEMCRSRRVAPRLGVHPRLQVLGPLEARLITADRVVLAGLNEGVWPPGPGADPWLSAGMRRSVGLGAPERRYGLAAHDFAQLAAAPRVVMTRSEKSEGAPTVASRWLWRLKTLARGALGDAAETALQPARDYAALARALDDPGRPPQSAPRPAPRPPVAVRPRKMSITEISTWVRDPYAIYARHVLGLRRLDPADMPPGPRERGSALHDALEAVVPGWGETVPDDAVAQLLAHAETQLAATGFGPEEMVLERARFERAARWLIAWETGRRGRGICLDKVEISGAMSFDGPAGSWTLTGRSDRFDRHPDGRLDIIDYKTGRSASPKSIVAGFDPQLPLTAAMAQAGVFPELAAGDPAGLFYVSLSGNAGGGKEERIDGGRQPDAAEFVRNAVADLTRWIARFDDETMAYESQIRVQYMNDYGDFDHLARRGEWASAAGETSGEET